MDDITFSSSSLESGSSGLSDDETDDDSSLEVPREQVERNNHDGTRMAQDNVECGFGLLMDDSEYVQTVRRWVLQVPIGLGFCPWAGKSHGNGNLRYVPCLLETPEQVMEVVYSEMERLIVARSGEDDDEKWKYSTTLVICPFVNEWKNYEAFEKFVYNGCLISKPADGESKKEFQHRIKSYTEKRLHFKNEITLVPFHPEFILWRGLHDGMGVGTTVQSYWGMVGSKSESKASATIIETENKVFGKQKVKIRFHQELEGRRLEQYVPIHWILDDDNDQGPPLPDNAMHRAPYPTIHLISNQDLVSLSARDISRVKRKNAQRMMKLGWSGVQKALEND